MSKPPSDPELQRDLNRIWHPCTQMKDHETYPPLLVERAQGVYLYDRDGKSYLDAISSWWVNLFGHGHPRLNSAVKEQLERMAHVMFAGITHRPAIALAESIVRLTPDNLTRVFFSDNGSTAVEAALKLSLQYRQLTGEPERKRIVYLRGAYHGETLGALSACGIGMFRRYFEDVLAENIEAEGPDCFRCPYGLRRETCRAECFAAMERTLNESATKVSAVIVEPLVQGAAGMKMYPPVYLRRLQDLCNKLGVHTIYDEVAVAFGRTGHLFVCGGLELQPTFLCLSKAITSGYLPLAATLTEEKIYRAFYDGDPGKMFIHSHSYSANPLACACANATLELLAQDGFWQTQKDKASELARACEVFRELPVCGEVRQTGMIAAVELVQDRQAREPLQPEKRLGLKIHREALKRGLFLRPLGNVAYFIPPLTITAEEIRFMVTAARDAIATALTD